jgi:hypothetical protein
MKAFIPFAMLAAGSLSACGGSGSGAPQPSAPSNSTPVARADIGRTRPGVAVDIAVLANDSDAEGSVLTILPPGEVTSATVSLQPDNRLRVLPAAGFGGTIEFNYRVRDAAGALSEPASVRVTVAPAGRAMLGTASAGGGAGRVLISGRAPGDAMQLLEATCNLGRFAAISSDMRTLLGVQCGTTTARRNLVMMAPRAATLSPPVALLTDVALAPGFAASADGNTVTVAERVTNPDDPSVAGTYELVEVDVRTRTVSRRLPLPDIDRLQGLRSLRGSDRVLLSTSTGGGVWPFPPDGDLYFADLQAGSVVRVGAPSEGVVLDAVFTSADGRFVLFPDQFGDLVGYDLTQPSQRVTFWSTQARGSYATQLSIAPASNGSTMLMLVRALFTGVQSVWELPLHEPTAAREIRACVREWSSGTAFQIVATDRFLLVCDAAQANHTEVNEVSLESGATVRQWTPAGGVPGFSDLQRLGSEALLLDFEEPSPTGTRRRIAYVHTGDPGNLSFVLPDADLSGALLGLADRDGTAFALTTFTGGVMTPHIVDVNLLTQAFPIQEGLAAGEEATAMMVFSPTEE